MPPRSEIPRIVWLVDEPSEVPRELGVVVGEQGALLHACAHPVAAARDDGEAARRRLDGDRVAPGEPAQELLDPAGVGRAHPDHQLFVNDMYTPRLLENPAPAPIATITYLFNTGPQLTCPA